MRTSTTLIVAAMAVLGFASTAAAQQTQDTNVTVGISGVTQLDVRPATLDYTSSGTGDALSPGDARTTSDEGYKHIEVENIGSERIGNIYAQATMHDQQPFGTDSSDSSVTPHNTGNFVTVSLDGANNASYGFGAELSNVDTMHYLNRVEYFEENPPTYIQTIEPNAGNDLQSTGNEVTSVDVGRFKVGGADYFFVVYGQGTGDDQILIGRSPHTSTVQGTSDFTNTGSDYITSALSTTTSVSGVTQVNGQEFVSFDTSSQYYDGQSLLDSTGTADVASELSNNISAQTRSYNLYVNQPEGYVLRTKFNVEQQSPDYNSSAGAPTDSTNFQLSDSSGEGSQEYILAASSESESLQPGENFPINFGVQVPNGVDKNAISQGTVSVIATEYTPS